MTDPFAHGFDDQSDLLRRARDVLVPALHDAAGALRGAVESGRTVLVAGNGGSAAHAAHFVAELVGRLSVWREPVAAVAIGSDAATLTALANDLGYEAAFARQAEALARPGDVFVAISTSGTSPNVVQAAQAARKAGCTVVGLTGDGGGDLGEWCDVLIAVPSTVVSAVQAVHGLCLHLLADAIEADLRQGEA